jgi:hypothetical protein
VPGRRCRRQRQASPAGARPEDRQQLEPDEADYTVEIPVSYRLAAHVAGDFTVPLRSVFASTHDFRVTLLTSAGEVDCGAVHLEARGQAS